MTKATLMLVLLMSLFRGQSGDSNRIAGPNFSNGVLQSYAPINQTSGWILLDGRLFITNDDGAHWQDITPSKLPNAQAHAILFQDALHGMVAIAQNGYWLAQTNDGGKTWQDAFLPNLGDDEAFAPASLELRAQADGSLALFARRATSSAFRMGVWWRSADGGQSWQRADEPAQEPSAQSAIANPNSLQTLKIAGPGVAWATQVDGACAGNACQTTTALFATRDSGAHWQAIRLPGATGLADGVLAEQAFFAGQGFDICEAPSLNQLQTWLTNSPYRVVNLYIGGSSRGCRNASLNANFVSRAAAMGWGFITTWVGPQTPCSVFGSKFSADAAQASAQGKTEAEQAVAQVVALGLGSAITPTAIYYDLEAYPTSDANCRAAARAFMDGWTQRIRELRHIPAVYGAGCGSAVADFVAIPHIPEAVWLAYWTRSAYDATITAWNVPCLGNDVWSNHQRLRQYTNSHDETWGGVTLNIDSNVLDGPVSGLTLPTDTLNRKMFLPVMVKGR